LNVTRIRHTGIVVSDMQRSLPFYRDLLGLEVWADFVDESPYVAAITGVPNAKIWMIKLRAPDGVSIELLQYLSHPQPAPVPASACNVGCQHVALQVENVERICQLMTANGIFLHSPPLGSPDGGARVTYCRDPEGVIIELVETLAKDPRVAAKLAEPSR
jgi:catechol 2,3-dioxygenase-like lactoylglutathione lyase family enzyme